MNNKTYSSFEEIDNEIIFKKEIHKDLEIVKLGEDVKFEPKEFIS